MHSVALDVESSCLIFALHFPNFYKVIYFAPINYALFINVSQRFSAILKCSIKEAHCTCSWQEPDNSSYHMYARGLTFILQQRGNFTDDSFFNNISGTGRNFATRFDDLSQMWLGLHNAIKSLGLSVVFCLYGGRNCVTNLKLNIKPRPWQQILALLSCRAWMERFFAKTVE